ncbi:MAG: hypothetical protein JXR96_16605 [Deltaproteobacteria bacterium]|nr:hypothetical protein [Deltaproteobacteria bacterium]
MARIAHRDRRFPSIAVCLASLAALAGCRFTLVEDLYVLDGMEACEKMSLEQLAQKARGYDHGTDSFELKCALSALRDAQPAPIHRTSLPARICYLLADRTPAPTSRERLAAEGVRWAEIALEETREEGPVRYFLAANLGLAVYDHTALAIKNLKRISKELERAIELSPGVDQGGPLRVMGMLLLMAPPWPRGIGDGERACELLERAVREYPLHPLNHIFYAQALWEVEEEEAEDEVKEHMRRGLELLDQGRWGDAKQRWTKLLQELAKEANANVLPPPGS